MEGDYDTESGNRHRRPHNESGHGRPRGQRGGGRGRGNYRHGAQHERQNYNQGFRNRPSRGNYRHNDGPQYRSEEQHSSRSDSQMSHETDRGFEGSSYPVPLADLEIEPPFHAVVPGRNVRDRQYEGRSQRGARRGGRSTWYEDADNVSSSPTGLNPNAVPFEPKNPSQQTNEFRGNSRRGHGERNHRGHGERDHRYPRSERNHRPFRNSERPSAERRSEISKGRPEVDDYKDDDEVASTNSKHESSPGKPQHKSHSAKGKPKNQREVLIDQLSRNVYECMVCCDKVRYSNPIWSCKRCFNVFHLHCIRKWASSSGDESGWRCPGCQIYTESSPDGYYCFCGKTKNPKAARHEVPHTCGGICAKPNPGGLNCTHTCISQCHPGPCPSCEVQLVRYCGCGKTNAHVLCGSKAFISCGSPCNKKLACGAHNCSRTCHVGDCNACDEEVIHECYCGKDNKKVPCTVANNQCKLYSCSTPCEKPLSCGMHKCERTCHSGSCGPCKMSPEAVLSCPCGQTPIDDACSIARMKKRTKCTDPIPTCGKICLRILTCGGDDEKHRCQSKCHFRKECPICKLVSNVRCRCGSKVMEIPCKELKDLNEITCQKKCTKKRSCGKHKCNTICCIDIDHICPIVCQRQLRCGNHNCTRLCHLTPCPPCDIASFDELSCECGASVIYPPIPCGTRRPPCLLPCSREHACDHPVHHPCHSEVNCPPCTFLTEKWCHGMHELRKNIMCHITEISCGLPCGKILPCKRHKCPKTCHAGACLKEDEECQLPCVRKRSCGHQCGAPCHDGECPDSKCKLMTEVVCPCGRRVDTLVCWKRDREYDRTVTWEYNKELKRLEEESKAKNETIEISEEYKEEIMTSMKEKIPKSAVLECDKECARIERNRKMAEALQVEDDDVTTSIGTPNYSEFLTKFAKKNPQFVEMVHKNLQDLVVKAKQSRKKNETYGFNSMNRDKRHVVHEYCVHFGMHSESFDEEPNRNVICFASKETSRIPSVSLIDAVFRPTVKSERLRPNDDVSFSYQRTQIVGPSQWNMKSLQKSSDESRMVALSTPATASGADFPPL